MAVDVADGADLLSAAKLAGDKILPNTAKSGHSRIQHDLDTLSQDYTELKGQVEAAQASLEACLSRWVEFERAQETFGEWLSDTSQKLKKEVEPKATLEQKEKQLQQQQVQLLYHTYCALQTCQFVSQTLKMVIN